MNTRPVDKCTVCRRLRAFGVALALALPLTAQSHDMAEPVPGVSMVAGGQRAPALLPKTPPVARPTGAARVVTGVALIAGGTTLTAICMAKLDRAPDWCVTERRVGFDTVYRKRNLLPIVGIGVAATGGLLLVLPSKKDQKRARDEYLAPTSALEDAGRVDLATLGLRGAEYEHKRVSTVASFGGTCTLPGDQTWVLFPLHAEGVQSPGPCTMVSPVMGAILRAQSAPLDSIQLNDTVVLTGVVTKTRIMPGQAGQVGIEIESIKVLVVP